MKPMRTVEFHEHAKRYETNLDRYLRRTSGTSALYAAEAKANQFIKIVKGGQKDPSTLRCLDVGCGTGLIPSLLSNSGIKVYGVDLSYQMIAEKEGGQIGTSKYLVSDSTNLPFSDGSFDHAYSVCVFHHLDEPSRLKTLKEMNRVTKPGGYIIVFEHNPYNPFTQIIVKGCPLDRDAKLVSLQHMKKLFASAALQPVQQGYILFFPEFLSFFKLIEPKIACVPLGAQYFIAGQKI